jgi:hypothetical protein
MLAVFGRLDSFQKRVGQVLLLFEAIVDFNKLEKIDVGGTKVCLSAGFFIITIGKFEIEIGQNVNFTSY